MRGRCLFGLLVCVVLLCAAFPTSGAPPVDVDVGPGALVGKPAVDPRIVPGENGSAPTMGTRSWHPPTGTAGTPSTLAGSYYEWGWAKTCHDVDMNANPPTCIGESSIFYCADAEIHFFFLLLNVYSGGAAHIEVYRPGGILYAQGDLTIDAPDPGYYWTYYYLDAYLSIAGGSMVSYPGAWQTKIYIQDNSQWVLESTLNWTLTCQGQPTPSPTPTRTPECPGAATRSYVTTQDNENNQHTGSPDGDMGPDPDCIFRDDSNHPIEFNIYVPTLSPPFSSATLSLRVWDVDEEVSDCPERDAVYFNGNFVGYLRGANDSWSTSGPYNINPSWVKQGNNLVEIQVNTTGCLTSGGLERWCVGVERGLLQLEGGSGAAYKRSFSKSPETWVPGSNGTVQVEVDTSLSSQEVMVEINVLDAQNNVLVGDSQTKVIHGTQDDAFVFTLPIPGSAPSGDYRIQVIIYDVCSGTIQESQEHPVRIGTPTYTPTVTQWPTRTNTPTSTRTRTPTPTATRSPTRTNTPTPTVTQWPTRTNTPTPTVTTWATRTRTPTVTPTSIISIWKAGDWVDYAPSGMPDFDQRQDQWVNPRSQNWSYCGPLAVANCLWWFDSKFEPNPVSPPAISDHYRLVESYSPGQWDDHDPRNLPRLVEDLARRMDTDGQRTGSVFEGTYVQDLYDAVVGYLSDKGLADQYSVTLMNQPSFEWVAAEVARCEDVILLLGFWSWDGSKWQRVGGHFVTTAGVNPDQRLIAFSNPIEDRAESGWPGRVLNGTLITHAPIPGHGYTVHNDAGNISHDVFHVVNTDSPGGTWGPADYVSAAAVTTFFGQNFPRDFPEEYRPKGDVEAYSLATYQTEVEYAVAISPAEGPPVDFPPHEKPYAEEEIEIYPYPVQPGMPTKLCVTIVNKSSQAQTVEVEFALAAFGIGLPFTPITAAGNPQTVTVPPNGTAKACIVWTPTVSDAGHRCIQVTIRQPGYPDVRSQKNLDIVEPLVPGQFDSLTLPVGNPLPQVADIEVRVFSHCSGWTVYAEPSLLASMGYGEVRDVVLHVLPPVTATLGSGCYIDVEAWALVQPEPVLLGGVRKVDYPPLEPRHPEDPPYAQREIEVNPYPLEVGRRTEICATLYNPSPVDLTVTIEFSLADFGIGLPFTPITDPNNPQTVTIPAYGSRKVCVHYMPTHAGHVCVQIRISRPGYKDVYSQRNLDVVEPLRPGQTDTLEFPLGNPLNHTADIDLKLFNNCRGWEVEADPRRLENMSPGEVRNVRIYFTPQAGLTLGTECTVDIEAWADGVLIGGIRKVDRPPVPHPPSERPYDEREIEVRPFPPEVGVETEICAVLDNKGSWPQTVHVEFAMADFTMGVPFQPIAAPGNPRTVTLPAYSTVKTCLQWTPLTPGHKCFQIRISQQGYDDIISQKNLDVGEHLRPGVQDQLVITVGNPKAYTADIQVVVYTECPGWQAWVEPEIVRNVPSGGTRDVTLRVVPPAQGATLGSGCYIDVESYINGELIGGIRKVDLPPVHPPLGEPPYAEREMWFVPDPPVVGQPAQVCAELHNYSAVQQTIDATLYVADWGIGLPFEEVGGITNWTIPANSTAQRCLPWTPTPGSTERSLQIRIQQPGYEDIVSQRSIVLLPALQGQTKSVQFPVGNPTGETRTVQIDLKTVGVPEAWGVRTAWTTMELQPGETISNTVIVESPGQGSGGGQLGDEQIIAVEAFAGDELLGGIQLEFEVPQQQMIYLPVILKRQSGT
jgi:hypothetical protein